MMRKTKRLLFISVFLVAILFSGTSHAFSDIADHPYEDKIINLKNEGIISGFSDGTFAPQQTLTFAQGIVLITTGLDLDTNESGVVREPQASDYFDHIPNEAWYASSFIRAHLNGLTVPADIKPTTAMTKEQFTHYLFEAILTTGDYAFIEIYRIFADENEVTPQYMDSVQKMLIIGIANVDEEDKFHPQQPITRAEAAAMLHDAMQFIQKHQVDQHTPLLPTPGGLDPDFSVTDDEVKVSIEPVHENIQKITLSWGWKPNSGYRLLIDKIEFKEQVATIYYRKHIPGPNEITLQVLTNPTATTYVSSMYEVNIVEQED